MASKAQKKLQKKKAREKDKRNKVLTERERLRAPARAERAEKKREKRIARLQKDMDEFTHMSTESLQVLPDDALRQLEKNTKILKALENEYVEELETKQKLQEKLEAEGHLTLEDKMKAMQNVDRPQEIGICGGADCAIGPPPADTADVEVVKSQE